MGHGYEPVDTRAGQDPQVWDDGAPVWDEPQPWDEPEWPVTSDRDDRDGTGAAAVLPGGARAPRRRPAGAGTGVAVVLVMGAFVVGGLVWALDLFRDPPETAAPVPVVTQTVTPEPSAPPAVSPEPSPEPSQDVVELISPAGVQALDPQGDGEENDQDAPRSIDGDPGSQWTTQRYNSQDFGGLKDGMGLVFDLGEPREVSQVIVDAPGDGGTYEVRTADGPGFDGSVVVASGETGERAERARTRDPRHHAVRARLVHVPAGERRRLAGRRQRGAGAGAVSTGASDAGLLDAHLAGDPDAFGELVRRHRDVLWAVALRTTGNPSDAEDALQEAMISALRSVERFERRSAVRTWLYRIVVNASLDRLRRNAARPTAPLADDVDPASDVDDSARTADRLDIMAALQQLSPGQRAAVVLVHVEGMSVAEAAEILDLPEGTVKSRCSRGRAQLAELLRPGNRDGHGRVEPSDGQTPAAPPTTGRAGDPA